MSTLSTTRRPPISATVICYNELRNIGRCLAALAFCDEIVVVDSGSTDGTRQIVEAQPRVRMLTRPFDSFSSQKNYALDACQHDWVLCLDADEVITPGLRREISGLDFAREGYLIGRRSYLGDQEIRYGTWNPDFNLRLFRRSLGRWGGVNPHASVTLDGSLGQISERMLHYSYRSRDEFLKRNEKYTRTIVEDPAYHDHRSYLGEATLHAVGNFFKGYVLKQGFRDGAAGLFIAWHMARLSHLKYKLLKQAAHARQQVSGATRQCQGS